MSNDHFSALSDTCNNTIINLKIQVESKGREDIWRFRVLLYLTRWLGVKDVIMAGTIQQVYKRSRDFFFLISGFFFPISAHRNKVMMVHSDTSIITWAAVKIHNPDCNTKRVWQSGYVNMVTLFSHRFNRRLAKLYQNRSTQVTIIRHHQSGLNPKAR